jgi:hypothetical protein
MKTFLFTSLFVICTLFLNCSAGPNDEQIKQAVKDNYCESWFFKDLKLHDFSEFQNVTVLKKLTEGQECIVLCEISFKPKEIQLKSEVATIPYKYDPSESEETNKTLEGMQRRQEVNEATDYNKTITELSKMLKVSDYKITRTFRFVKFSSDWFYKGLIPRHVDPYVSETYAKFSID